MLEVGVGNGLQGGGVLKIVVVVLAMLLLIAEYCRVSSARVVLKSELNEGEVRTAMIPVGEFR